MRQVKITANRAARAAKQLHPGLFIEDVFVEVEYPNGSGEQKVALNAGEVEVPILISALESSGLTLQEVVEVPREEFEDTVWVIPNAIAGKDL